MNCGGVPADESYSPVFVVGAGSTGAGGGVDAVGADARLRARGAGAGGAGEVAGAGAPGPFNKSAGNRLTLETVVAGGPTGAATVLPTVILSASG